MEEQMSFEEALSLLEGSVARLEQGEVKLDEALQVFEQGVRASRICARWLQETRRRVQVLTSDDDGEFHLSFLDEDGPDSDAETPDAAPT